MAAKGNSLTQSRRDAEVAEKVRLGDVCTPLKGEQINGSELSDKFGYPFLNGGVEPSGKWRDYNVSGGTVTVSEGGNSCGFVNYMEDDFWCGAHCYYLSNPRCDSKYLFHSLKAKQKEIQALRTGVCMPNIKKSVISNFAIKYHCEVEIQRRIAAELDKICELKKNAETRLEKLDLLVKSRFVEMFGDPNVNPRRWKSIRLLELMTHANNGMTRRGCDVEGEIVLRIVELRDGYIDYSAPNRIKLTNKEREKFLLCHNDFLFVRVNGNPQNVGRCARFVDVGEPVYHNDHIIRVKFDERVDVVYMSALLNGSYGKDQIRSKLKTSAGQYTINQDGIGEIIVPLPPLDLQREFATFVAKVDKLRENVRETVAKMDMLYRSKLQEYFG